MPKYIFWPFDTNKKASVKAHMKLTPGHTCHEALIDHSNTGQCFSFRRERASLDGHFNSYFLHHPISYGVIFIGFAPNVQLI